MAFENLEKALFENGSFDLSDRMKALHNAFDSKNDAKEGYYVGVGSVSRKPWANWLNIDDLSRVKEISAENIDTVKRMYYGSEVDGKHTLGLKEISEWKTNGEYINQNIHQQSGYSAEVASTAKENVIAQQEGTGITTYRADDRPDLFPKNDQYVDKIRVDSSGKIVERVQTKFVGSDGSSCLDKLASKEFEKYLTDGKVDRLEIPSNHYDQIRSENLIQDRIDGLQKQIDNLKANGKYDIAEQKQAQIEKYKKIDEMLERSTVSSDEALYARRHPDRYVKKLFITDNIKQSHEIGKQSGLTAAGITVATSTVDNVKSVMAGEKTAVEAFSDVAVKTGEAGALGYGTGFVSSYIAGAMSQSSHELIRSLSDAGVPAAVVSFGVASYDSISDYSQGLIDGKQLAIDLGENSLGISGSMAGGAIGTEIGAVIGGAAGGVIGSVVPGAGNIAGAAIGSSIGGTVGGLVGGMVGYAVTTEAYRTAVEFGSEGADVLAEKAKALATDTLEQARTAVPEKAEALRTSINSFASEHSLPFQL